MQKILIKMNFKKNKKKKISKKNFFGNQKEQK